VGDIGRDLVIQTKKRIMVPLHYPPMLARILSAAAVNAIEAFILSVEVESEGG
jgi:hypothetical protein